MPITNEQIVEAVATGIRDAMTAIRDTVEAQNNSPESRSLLSGEDQQETK